MSKRSIGEISSEDVDSNLLVDRCVHLRNKFLASFLDYRNSLKKMSNKRRLLFLIENIFLDVRARYDVATLLYELCDFHCYPRDIMSQKVEFVSSTSDMVLTIVKDNTNEYPNSINIEIGYGRTNWSFNDKFDIDDFILTVNDMKEFL